MKQFRSEFLRELAKYDVQTLEAQSFLDGPVRFKMNNKYKYQKMEEFVGHKKGVCPCVITTQDIEVYFKGQQNEII